MKLSVCTIFGTVGSIIAMFLGGWDMAVITLCIFMGIDLITGVIVAFIFHKSPKTNTGTMSSRVGWKGLAKKGVTLLFVGVAVRLDMLIGSTYIRDAVCIAFISNELISIIENAGLMGIPIPAIITKSIDILKEKEANKNE